MTAPHHRYYPPTRTLGFAPAGHPHKVRANYGPVPSLGPRNPPTGVHNATLPTLSRSLENWPGLEFKGFLAELKKAKVQLTLAEEAEWLGYFTAEKAKAQALQAQIAKTDKEIDALVYQLYGLTEEEVKVVEGK